MTHVPGITFARMGRLAAWYCPGCSKSPRTGSRPCPQCCGWAVGRKTSTVLMDYWRENR